MAHLLRPAPAEVVVGGQLPIDLGVELIIGGGVIGGLDVVVIEQGAVVRQGNVLEDVDRDRIDQIPCDAGLEAGSAVVAAVAGVGGKVVVRDEGRADVLGARSHTPGEGIPNLSGSDGTLSGSVEAATLLGTDLTEVALTLQRGGYAEGIGLRRALAGAFEIEEGEDFILLERAADGAAEVVPVIGRVGLARLLGKPVFAVQDGVSEVG